MGQGSIQHGMQEMNPRIRVCLGPPKELSWEFLNGILFHIRQNEQQFVGEAG